MAKLLKLSMILLSVLLHLLQCNAIPTPDVEIEPVDMLEINSDVTSQDEVPLVVDVESPEGGEHKKEDLDDIEDMETAHTLVFRPYFRNQNVERRSIRAGERRSQSSAESQGYNYMSNPPPYLVYNRRTGAYHPYYYPQGYNTIRRS